jgi:hypothetical protein
LSIVGTSGFPKRSAQLNALVRSVRGVHPLPREPSFSLFANAWQRFGAREAQQRQPNEHSATPWRRHGGRMETIGRSKLTRYIASSMGLAALGVRTVGRAYVRRLATAWLLRGDDHVLVTLRRLDGWSTVRYCAGRSPNPMACCDRPSMVFGFRPAHEYVSTLRGQLDGDVAAAAWRQPSQAPFVDTTQFRRRWGRSPRVPFCDRSGGRSGCA